MDFIAQARKAAAAAMQSASNAMEREAIEVEGQMCVSRSFVQCFLVTICACTRLSVCFTQVKATRVYYRRAACAPLKQNASEQARATQVTHLRKRSHRQERKRQHTREKIDSLVMTLHGDMKGQTFRIRQHNGTR